MLQDFELKHLRLLEWLSSWLFDKLATLTSSKWCSRAIIGKTSKLFPIIPTNTQSRKKKKKKKKKKEGNFH